MTDRTRRTIGGRWIGAAMSIVLLAPAFGWSGSLDPTRVRWTELSFRARKFVFSFESELAVDLVAVADLGPEWIDSAAGRDIHPASGSVIQLTLDAHGMGRASETRLWIDAENAEAIQRSQVRSNGRKHRHKTMRFTERGVEVVSRRPVAGEDPARPESWTKRTDRFDRFPAWASRDLEVSEPTALFYLLAAARLDDVGDRVELPILSDGHLIRVELVVSSREEVDVDYVKVTPTGEEVVRGSVPALKILVSGRLLDPSSKVASLEFMGMKGDVEILLDPETRAPLQVSGRVPLAGRAHARIQRVVLGE